jgi:multidrug resistance efflux pump
MGKISSKGYLFNWRHHLLPVVVWLATVACVVGLFSYRARRFEVLGMAQGQIRQVAATCPGRIISVPVELFDEVKKGQIVAVLDTILEDVNRPEDIKAQLATISAEIEHLSAQLIAAQDTLIAEKTDRETNRLADQRRFSADVDNARLQILSLRAQIASDQITLDDLAMEVKIVEDLLNKGAVAAYELEKAKVQHESLAKKVEENGRLLEEAQNDLKEALQRQQEYARTQPYHPSVDSALDVIRKEIKVQERLMDELLVQHKPLEIRSPIDGVVVQVPGRANETLTRRPGEKVLRRAGEVVVAGEPIVAIAETQSREIVAYVSARQLGRLQDKMTVEVVKDREPAQIAMAQVVSVGPVMELMPEQLWRNPTIPQWGLPILIRVPPGLKVIPGEVVGVRGL